MATGLWKAQDQAADYLYAGDNVVSFALKLPEGLAVIYDAAVMGKGKASQFLPTF